MQQLLVKVYYEAAVDDVAFCEGSTSSSDCPRDFNSPAMDLLLPEEGLAQTKDGQWRAAIKQLATWLEQQTDKAPDDLSADEADPSANSEADECDAEATAGALAAALQLHLVARVTGFHVADLGSHVRHPSVLLKSGRQLRLGSPIPDTEELIIDAPYEVSKDVHVLCHGLFG